MAVSTGISFTLSDALQQAEKMDNHFNKWVQQSIEINSNMAKAFDSKGGGNMGHYIQGLKDMKSLIGEIGKGKLSVEVDTSKTEQMANALDRISTYVGLLEKSGVQIFDTQGLYASNKGIIETEDNLASLQEQIESVKEQWHNLLDDSLRGGFEPPINEKTGKAFRKDSKVYKEAFDALETEIERTREQRKEKQLLLEFELKQLIEREAIAKKELNYAKMTQDEKAKYIQKKLNEILKAEEQQANKIRAEYKTLNQELRNAVNSRSAIEEASKNKSLTEDEEEALIAIEIHEEELRAKIQKMEREHLEYISDLKVSYAIKDAKKIADIIKNRQYSASEALAMASTARTGDEMETAKEAVKGALMTVDKDDLKTIADLNKAYIDLRANIEKLTKAQKNEQTLQPTLRNEYARILAEIDKVTEAKKRLEATEAYKAKDKHAIDDYKALEAREADLMRRKAEIRQNNEALLTEIETKHEAERAQKRVEALAKREKAEAEYAKKYAAISSKDVGKVVAGTLDVSNISQAEKAIQDLKDARDKLDKNDKKYEKTLEKLNAEIKKHEEYIESVTDAEKHREAQQKKQRENYKGAMDYSKQAKSINDLKEAIRVLEVARQNEDLSTRQGKKNYRELTRELEAQQNRYDKLTNKIKSSSRGLIDTAGQLKRAFGLLFSVSQIRGYIHSIIEVRGEFEMQHRSMQVLIGDIDKANELWDKTVSLATKSPFRVKELVTYTKQLAAYRVEADKLYETNKMLADISSGLGVDMNRLILAFGQVKAANYLRGTELRQFSEAGINILELLAERFEEIQGRAISTGEVFEMVSKRLVSFEDVNAVLQQVTSEGGMFYQMQEKQSETLQGMIRNLRDSIDLMMNDMGISMNDELKNAVTLVKNLVDEWRKLVPIIASLGVAMLFNTARKGLLFLIGGIDKMIKGFSRLKAASSAAAAVNPWLLLATVIASVTAAVIAARKEVNRFAAAMGQVESNNKKQLTESISLYRKLAESATDATKTELEREKAMENLKQRFGEILPDSLLEAEYVKQLGMNYEEANRAMMAYYDAKTREQKKDKVDAMFESDIYEKAFPKLISGLKYITKTTSALTEEQKILVESYAGNIFGDIINSAKNGEIEVENLFDTFKKRLSEYTEIEVATIDEMFHSGGSKWVEDRLEDLGALLEKYQNTLSGITGLSYTTKSEEVAMEWKNAEKANLEAIMAEYKKFATYYHQFSTANKKEREKIAKSVSLSLSQVPEELALYKPHLEKAVNDLKEAAEGGAWSFASSMQKIEQSFVKGLKYIVSQSLNGQEYDKYSYAGEFLVNFATNMKEGIDKAAEDLDLSNFQEGIIDGVEKVVEKTKVSVDEFAKYLPKMGESLSDVKNRVSGDIEVLKTRVEDYTTSISTGLDKTYIISDKILNENSEQIKYFENSLIPALQLFLQLLGDMEKPKGGGGGSLMDERIKVVDDMNRAYKELNKTLSKNEALEGAFAKYKDAFQKAYAGTTLLPKNFGTMTAEQFLKEFDFTTEEGMVGFFDKLIAYAKKTGEQVDVELAKGEYIMEARLELKKDEDKKLLDEVQTLFDQYDLSLELKKLNIPPDLAKSLFGIESINLADIRKKVQGELDSAKAAGGQEDRVAQLEKDLEKINDMEDKAQVERLKTYLQYTRSAIGERAKIKVEEMNKLMEIEETFNKASSKAKTEEDKKRIEEQRKLAIAGVQKESSDKTNKLDWDEFRSSDTFVSMFQDLDAASDALLNHAISKIKEFQDQWTDMPISDAKEMIDKLNELEMALLDTGKPFKDYRNANQEIENAMLARQIKPDAKSSKSQQALREDIGAENKEMEDMIANSERVIALLEIINNANAETKQQELEKLGINQSYVESLGLSADVLTNSAEANNEIIRDEKQKAKDAQKNIGLNQKVLNQLNKQKDRLNEQADAIGKAQQMANDLYEAFSELAEALGADSDSPAAIFADMGMNMLNTVLNTIQLQLQLHAAKGAAQGLGAAMNAAMGVVGWIVMAVQLLAQVITAIVQANDKKIDAQVERLRAQVEELEKKYDKLSETIDEVYSTAELEEVSRKLDEIYYKEKRALEQAIAVRKADKNISDDEMDEIADMEEQLIELEEKHAENMKEIGSNATDGILDSIKDAARDFTDAWYDAFVETGKGINGLEENFNEMFMNLAKQQASMQITQAFVEKWKRDLSKYVNEKDTDLTPEDAAAWANDVKATFPELSAALEAFLGTIHESVGGLQSGELSSLQKGIQGITEETAQIIEAYLNSIRGYVSEQVTHTRNIYNILKQATTSDAAAIRVRMVE